MATSPDTNVTTLLISRATDAVDTAVKNLLCLERHPLSKAFPDMTEEEQSALTKDIYNHDQRQPIILLDGMVLDGWHRYIACLELNIEPITVPLADGVDPVAFVLSGNIHRRHMDATQRGAAVARCVAWVQSGENQHTRGGAAAAPPADGAAAPMTNVEMAEAARVSVRTIQQAKAATAVGLGDALRDGLMTAEQGAEIAAKIAKLPEPEKIAAVAAALVAPKAVKHPKASKARFPTGDVPVVNITPPAKMPVKSSTPRPQIPTEVEALQATIADRDAEITELAQALDAEIEARKVWQEKCERLELEVAHLKANGTSAAVERVDQTRRVDLPVADEVVQEDASGEDASEDHAVMDVVVLEEAMEAAVVQAAVDETIQDHDPAEALLNLPSPLAAHVEALLRACPRSPKNPEQYDKRTREHGLYSDAADILEVEGRLRCGEYVSELDRAAYSAYLEAQGLAAVAAMPLAVIQEEATATPMSPEAEDTVADQTSLR